MQGLTRTELDEREQDDFAVGKGPSRPCDAATLLVLDRHRGQTRVLMGKRASRHAFMPGKFVFPGGKTDASDARIPILTNLHPDVEMRIIGASKRVTPARARAIALSAIRETYEEAGLLFGRVQDFATKHEGWQGFAEHSVFPDLGGLRFIARAITPPGRIRRYDTRFFALWRDDVALELEDGGPTKELEELSWLPLAEASQIDIPSITRMILQDLESRLSDDPLFEKHAGAPFYRLVNNVFQRDII